MLICIYNHLYAHFPICSQEDVGRLGQVNFLRLNGARNIGIRTSFGVPVVSRWGVTFVIVFYSRSAVQVCMCVCSCVSLFVVSHFWRYFLGEEEPPDLNLLPTREVYFLYSRSLSIFFFFQISPHDLGTLAEAMFCEKSLFAS